MEEARYSPEREMFASLQDALLLHHDLAFVGKHGESLVCAAVISSCLVTLLHVSGIIYLCSCYTEACRCVAAHSSSQRLHKCGAAVAGSEGVTECH